MLHRRRARTALLSILILLSACTPPTPFNSIPATPSPIVAATAPATDTPAPTVTGLEIDREALRGV
ncbi:MAG TPA: hypothetical protein VGK56_00625, partial [Anaerolineales bacterium]